MKIFISWSGERGKAAASALGGWLPLVLHYADPWLSDRDIAAGDRWATEVGRELEASHFGIIVLTPDSLNAPWILFEAGALSKAFTAAAVCPWLIDLDFRDISGPLAQFQAKKSDRESVLNLVRAINTKASAPVDPGRLTELFGLTWPKLEAELASLPSPSQKRKPRPEGQVVEELVTVVRGMETLLRSVLREWPSGKSMLGLADGLDPLPKGFDALPAASRRRVMGVDCVALYPEPQFRVRVRYDDGQSRTHHYVTSPGPEPVIRVFLEDEGGYAPQQVDEMLAAARQFVEGKPVPSQEG